jgi:rhamnulokinase
MDSLKDRRALIAVDLGAQSCRVSLLRRLRGGFDIATVYRAANAPVRRNGSLFWDWQALCREVDEGLRTAGALSEEGVVSIGVTGWAVDYVRLRPIAPDSPPPTVQQGNGKDAPRQEPERVPTPQSRILASISDPFCYRDSRTDSALMAVHARIPPERLYALTGIQVLPLNTIYQLYADATAGIPAGTPWLNLPEAMLYRWGARPVAEYTNATHTGLVAIGSQQWSPEIFVAAGLDIAAAPEIVPPGSIVGRFEGPLRSLPAFRSTLLIAPACHDTASAIAGIPASGDDWAFISSGTWSLVGTLLDAPCAGAEAARLNFTNLGGVGGKICFLRNVNGLWLLSQCLESWRAAGRVHTEHSLIEEAAQLTDPEFLLDVDDPELLAPGDMPDRIAAQVKRKHGSAAASKLESPAAVARLVLSSLSARYAAVLRDAAELTGRRFRRLYIVGGGSRNTLLNELTRRATGLDVILGSPESSTIGNFSVQLAALEHMERGGPSADDSGTSESVVEYDMVAAWARRLAGASGFSSG